ncbi:MAG: DUF4395 family protein [Omnitrophica WOR_2 bacterium]|jgi:hypothetical protein
MITYRPVEISKSSFAFCRFSLAVAIWVSFFLKSEVILAVVCVIFLLSAILKVKRAPMIVLFDLTFDKMLNSSKTVVDQNSIYFAHSLALAFSLICLASVLLSDSSMAWYPLFGFAILKTVSAFGFCPASKLYSCTVDGKCCMKSTKNEQLPD